MGEVKAYLSGLLFCGIGAYVLIGGEVAPSPDCIGKCYMDTISGLIEDIGRVPVAGLLFASGIFSFFWWKAKG